MGQPIPNIPNISNGVKDIDFIQVNRSGTGIRILPQQIINQVNVQSPPNIYITDKRSWEINPPEAIPIEVPVTTLIGTPLVDMPGCVKIHKENTGRDPSINKNLVNDDPKGNTTLCDGGMPYFEPPNYDARELTWRTVYMDQEEDPEGIDTGDMGDVTPPETPEPPPTEEPEGDPDCPGPLQPRLGSVGPNEKEKVSGYELQPDPNNANKKICVVLYEDIGIVEQYLPSPQVATTTAVIASVAASSALLAKPLADLLLRVVKPAVKQVMTKVNAILGKTPYRPTQAELRTNEYRKKKGLLGINFAKEHQKKMKKEKERKKKESQKNQS